LLDWQRNQLFAPIAILLLWQAHLSFALEGWRKKYGEKIRFWIQSVGEIETLSSFSCYSYEHPEDPFPEIVDGTCFEGTGLGHPLIPENQCIRNSVELNLEKRLKIVSGSNMSGKSTLLRTIGVNAVLALAGAPVRAKHLRLSPLSIGASIHILDSLQTGSSRFYAEITRLRQIMDLAQNKPPVLFLLDEILHGTNSADRLIGAEAIVRGFLQRNAIGLLTTHDLALTNIADKLGPVAENIHFQDHIEDGRIAFDYRVHPGVVQKSNAIALMRAVGLEV
jgi:DNA mismatch repair ATPase MutS